MKRFIAVFVAMLVFCFNFATGAAAFLFSLSICRILILDKLKKAVSLEEKKADIATRKTRVIMEMVMFIDYPPLLLPQKSLLPYFLKLL